jgi:hypothetical protein
VDLKEIGWDSVHRINLARDRGQWRAIMFIHKNDLSDFSKGGKFAELLKEYLLHGVS